MPLSAPAWRANTGAPVATDATARLVAPPARVDLVCWNLAVGRARLDLLLERLRDGHGVGEPGGPPLVLLVQEAYRADASVPAAAAGAAHGGAIQPAEPGDIVDTANRHGLGIRYVPSMRNGRPASDRGNAVLSNVAFDVDAALPLPIVRQHRVAVAATLRGLAGVRFVSAHLDVGGPPPGRRLLWKFGGGRTAQARALVEQLAAHSDDCIVVGGDFNTHAGRFDPALRELRRHGFRSGRRTDGRGHTFHGPLPLTLDHVLVRSPGRRVRIVELTRIGDCMPWPRSRVLGSDHHPLLARLEVTPGRLPKGT